MTVFSDFTAGTMFTQPLAANWRLLRLWYSGFRPSRHNILHLPGSNPGRPTRHYTDYARLPTMVSQNIAFSTHIFELSMLQSFPCMIFMNFTIMFSTWCIICAYRLQTNYGVENWHVSIWSGFIHSSRLFWRLLLWLQWLTYLVGV
jgi:hypothetical protein